MRPIDHLDGMVALPSGSLRMKSAARRTGGSRPCPNYGTRERPGATLSIIDLEHPLELRRIELGEWRRPHGVAWYAPDRIALSTEEPAGLLVIDPRAGHVVTQIATGQAGSHMVAVAPDASRAFITNRGGGSTTVIDLARGRKLADVTTASARKRSPSRRTAARSGLPRAFAAAWTLRNDAAMRNAGIDPMGLAKEAEEQLTKFPNAAVNSDEQRRFRAALYKPLVKLPQDERARVVDLVVKVLLETGGEVVTVSGPGTQATNARLGCETSSESEGDSRAGDA